MLLWRMCIRGAPAECLVSSIAVPAGKIQITVERGKEYVPLVREIAGSDGETIEVEDVE